MPPRRILVVDDSAFIRMTLARRLSSEPDIEVVGQARDGREALKLVQELRPDVVTMDVEMPGMSGLEALARIMSEHPTPVIMVSSLTHEGTETTVKALTLGAVDYVGKPSTLGQMQGMIEELANKIRLAAVARVRRLDQREWQTRPAPSTKAMIRPLTSRDRVIAIGSSTGGPGALRRLFQSLPGTLDAAIVIVQHMPPGFTRSLAARLDEESAWNVREAANGDYVRCGQALLAPGGYHLVCDRQGMCVLSSDAPVNNVRPAVDVMLQSVVDAFGARVIGVILTGMGRDGTRGSLLIHQAGGIVVAEHESTCAVYGMPRSVVEAGVADYVAPIGDIPALLHRLVGENGHERR